MSRYTPPPGGGSGGITEITSDDASVTITDPTGPTVDLSVAGGGGPLTWLPLDLINGWAAGDDTTPSYAVSGEGIVYLQGDLLPTSATSKYFSATPPPPSADLGAYIIFGVFSAGFTGVSECAFSSDSTGVAVQAFPLGSPPTAAAAVPLNGLSYPLTIT